VVLGGEAGSFMEEPWEAFRDGLCSLGFTVRILGSDAAGVERGLRILAPLLGSGANQSTSVIDALHDDTSGLSGAISAGNIRVLSIGSPRPVETLGGLVFIGIDIPLRIYATRL
jgi:hypothetical protein